jgi:uncharacterized protein
MPVFRHRVELDHPVERVFAWHREPGAFERLTPPWEDVRVREKSGGIEPGGRVVLELRKGPVPLTWEVEHTQFEANRLFVDEQVSGPFAAWRHEHRFEALGAGRCAVEDVVTWEAPLGALGETFGGGTIERMLERLFRFRGERLRGDLELHRRLARAREGSPGADRPLVVAVTGASGMIGSALTHLLTSGGHTVRAVTRSPRAGSTDIGWDPARGELDGGALEGLDAVVHLAGEPIVGVRWTEAKKKAIHRSREAGTLLLARTLAGLRTKPGVLVSASGIDYYGPRGVDLVTEAAPPGRGFLTEVCLAWEQATQPARTAGIRTVVLRTGIVLSAAGGVLGTILLPFQLGVGGRLGSGKQYMPWIDLDDHLGIILHALGTPSLKGPVNSVSPNPVPNAAFTDVMGRVLGRPTLLPVPSLAIRGLLGEMGRVLLLEGQRAVPEKARVSGYAFLRPDLEDSLRMQLGRFESDADATGAHATLNDGGPDDAP